MQRGGARKEPARDLAQRVSRVFGLIKLVADQGGVMALISQGCMPFQRALWDSRPVLQRGRQEAQYEFACSTCRHA